MSYSVRFMVDVGRADPVQVGESFGHTYNCAKMFDLALGEPGIRGLNGRKAADVITSLKLAVAEMTICPATFLPMEPSNGWGSLGSAKAFLEDILRSAEAMPQATIKVT